MQTHGSEANDTPTERREFGRLFQRNGTWYVRYRAGGRERTETLGTKSRAVAERKAAIIGDRVGRGDYQASDVRRVAFKDLETLILTDYQMRGLRSLPRLNSALAHLRETFGTSRALAITSDAITRYEADRLAAGAARASVAYELATLRRAFRLAIRHRRLTTMPSIVIHAPQNARTGFLNRDDLNAILAELPAYLRPVMLAGFLTGWRVRSELLPLEWRQVDLDGGTITLDVGSTKNGEGRVYPSGALPELHALLTEQHERAKAFERATGQIVRNVFTHDDGQPIKTYHHAWARAVHRAARGGSTEPLAAVTRPNVVGRVVHDLRRSAARALVHAGVAELTAMQLLGHRTSSMFRRYAIQDANDLRAAVAKLATASAPAPTKHGKASKPRTGRKAGRGTTGGQTHLRAVGETP